MNAGRLYAAGKRFRIKHGRVQIFEIRERVVDSAEAAETACSKQNVDDLAKLGNPIQLKKAQNIDCFSERVK